MVYAAPNLVCFVVFFASFCSWGYLVCGPSGRKGWMPAVGIASCAIFATLGFDCGLSIAATGRLVFSIAGFGGLLWCFRALRAPSGPSAASAAMPLAAAVLLAAPMAVGGAQFGLFQGNINDQFNYLASAVVRTTLGHRAIAAATPADFLRHSLLPIAHTMAGARPAVVDLYACLEGLMPGRLHVSHYGFLCSLLMGTFFAVAELVRSLCAAARWRAQLIAAAFVVGFWGQLQVDLNAWSWVAATPLAAACMGALAGMAPFSREPGAGRFDWRTGLALGLCVAGFLYVYPEMLVFLAPSVLLSAAVGAALLRGGEASRANFLFPAAVALVLAVPKLAAIVRFAAHQVSFTSRADFTPLSWMWRAISGGPVTGLGPAEASLRFLAGALGLSWLTGTPEARWTAILLAVALAAGAAACWRKLNPPRAPVGLAAAIVCLLAAQIAACVGLGYLWVAAKGVTYASVLAVPLVLVPAAAGRIEPWRAPAWMLICLQVTLGLFRPFAALNPDGIHYHIPYYPAVMDPVLKTARSWDVGDGPRMLASSRAVKIDVPDVWLETYAAICVQAQGLAYWKGLPVYVYLGISEENYGRQAPLPGFDALVYLEQDRRSGRAGLGFATRDGKVCSNLPGPRITRITSAEPLDTLSGLLAWRMRADGARSTTRIATDQAIPGSTDLEFGFLAPESARGALVLTVQTEAGTRASATAGGYGMGTVQIMRVPLKIRSARDEILLTLSAKDGRAGTDIPVTLVNPRLMVVAGARRADRAP